MKCTSNTQMHFMITSIPVFQNIHELQHLKRLVHSKIIPYFTHYHFFFQLNTIRVILKNILALPSFIMGMNSN